MLDASFFILCQLFFFTVHILQTLFANWIQSFDFCSFIHAVITTVLSHYIFVTHPSKLVNIFDISDIPESSFSHSVFKYLPLFSMAYGVYDIFSGILQKRWDFILHGVVMLTIIFISYIQDKSHVAVLPMTTELSTIFLAFRSFNNIKINMCFAFTFFLYRLILLPCISFYILAKICMDNVFASTLSIGQGTLNSLNGMWGYKIYKIIRKLFNRQFDSPPILLLEYFSPIAHK